MLYARFAKLMSTRQDTCIRVAVVTRNKLAKLGQKDQTFDQIVNSLLENLVVVKSLESSHAIFCSVCNNSLRGHTKAKLIECALNTVKRGEPK